MAPRLNNRFRMPGRTRRAASDYGRPPFGAAAPFCCRSDGLPSGCCIGMEERAFLLGGGVASRDESGTAADLSAAVFLLRCGLSSLSRSLLPVAAFFRRGLFFAAVTTALPWSSLRCCRAMSRSREGRNGVLRITERPPPRCGETAVCGSGSGRKRCPPGMEANGACLQSAVRGAVHRRGLRRCGACRSAPRWAIRHRFRP